MRKLFFLKIFIVKILFFSFSSLYSQDSSWISTKRCEKCEKRYNCFNAAGIDRKLEMAKSKALTDVILQASYFIGVKKKIIDSSIIKQFMNDDSIGSAESHVTLIYSDDVITFKNLKKAEDFYEIDKFGNYHQWYKFTLPKVHPAWLAFVPIGVQTKNKENWKAAGFASIEFLSIGLGLLYLDRFQQYKSYYNSDGYTHEQYLYFDRIQKNSKRISLISFIGGSGLFYFLSTVDGLSNSFIDRPSKRKRILDSISKKVDLIPYGNSNKLGISAYITLK